MGVERTLSSGKPSGSRSSACALQRLLPFRLGYLSPHRGLITCMWDRQAQLGCTVEIGGITAPDRKSWTIPATVFLAFHGRHTASATNRTEPWQSWWEASQPAVRPCVIKSSFFKDAIFSQHLSLGFVVIWWITRFVSHHNIMTQGANEQNSSTSAIN